MTDRELLELAAMAVGLKEGIGGAFWTKSGGIFDPLTDDGDALRLAVKLRLQVTPGTYWPNSTSAYRAGYAEAIERDVEDIYAATRRAIVRAAAEIGKGMK